MSVVVFADNGGAGYWIETGVQRMLLTVADGGIVYRPAFRKENDWVWAADVASPVVASPLFRLVPDETAIVRDDKRQALEFSGKTRYVAYDSGREEEYVWKLTVEAAAQGWIRFELTCDFPVAGRMDGVCSGDAGVERTGEVGSGDAGERTGEVGGGDAGTKRANEAHIDVAGAGRTGDVAPELVLQLGAMPPYDRGHSFWARTELAGYSRFDHTPNNDFPACYYRDPFRQYEALLWFDMEAMSWMGRSTMMRFRDYRLGLREVGYGDGGRLELGLYAVSRSGNVWPQGVSRIAYAVRLRHEPKHTNDREALKALIDGCSAFMPPSPGSVYDVTWRQLAEGAMRNLMDDACWVRSAAGEWLRPYVDSYSPAWSAVAEWEGKPGNENVGDTPYMSWFQETVLAPLLVLGGGVGGADGFAGTDGGFVGTDSGFAGTDGGLAETDSDLAGTDGGLAETDSGLAGTDSGLACTGDSHAGAAGRPDGTDVSTSAAARVLASSLAHYDACGSVFDNYLASNMTDESAAGTWQYLHAIREYWWIGELTGRGEIKQKARAQFEARALPLLEKHGFIPPTLHNPHTLEKLGPSVSYSVLGYAADLCMNFYRDEPEQRWLELAHRSLTVLARAPEYAVHQESNQLSLAVLAAARWIEAVERTGVGSPAMPDTAEMAEHAQYLSNQALRQFYWYEETACPHNPPNVRIKGLSTACTPMMYPALWENINHALLFASAWRGRLEADRNVLKFLGYVREHAKGFFPAVIGLDSFKLPYIPVEDIHMLEIVNDPTVGQEIYGTGHVVWAYLLFEAYIALEHTDPELLALCLDLQQAPRERRERRAFLFYNAGESDREARGAFVALPEHVRHWRIVQSSDEETDVPPSDGTLAFQLRLKPQQWLKIECYGEEG